MKAAAKSRLYTAAVWLERLIAGATFVVSGWAKAIDPWGFIIKVEEYLTVWGMAFHRFGVYRVMHGCDARHGFAQAFFGIDGTGHDGGHAASYGIYLYC